MTRQKKKKKGGVLDTEKLIINQLLCGFFES